MSSRGRCACLRLFEVEAHCRERDSHASEPRSKTLCGLRARLTIRSGTVALHIGPARADGLALVFAAPFSPRATTASRLERRDRSTTSTSRRGWRPSRRLLAPLRAGRTPAKPGGDLKNFCASKWPELDARARHGHFRPRCSDASPSAGLGPPSHRRRVRVRQCAPLW
jgi:hypothetical protein